MSKESKSFGAKAIRFAEDKGFYIILMLCVAAIGISGYVLFFSPDAQPLDPLDLGEYQPSAWTPPVIDQVIIPPVDVGINAPEVPVSAPAQVPAQTAPPVVTTGAVTKTQYYMPVAGELIRECSLDKLVYDTTMADWRTHNGIDLSCALGDRVNAIADGKVTGVYTDVLMGSCIEITHDKGLVSLYCNLSENKTMAVGTKVKGGEVIGAVGQSMKSESLLEAHLHLEVRQNGKLIDPMTLGLK